MGENTEYDIKQVDFHFHAGIERDEGKTLHDYITYAHNIGLSIIGITDHMEFYKGFELPQQSVVNYELSIKGLINYYNEIQSMKLEFNDMNLLFAPEYSSKLDLEDVPDEMIKLADYFICELHPVPEGSVEIRTEAAIQFLRQVRNLVDRSGKPAFYAHPLREIMITKKPAALQQKYSNTNIWDTMNCAANIKAINEQALNEYFMFDLRELAKASKRYGIPIEANHGTQLRVFNSGTTAMNMYYKAYTIFLEEGVDIIPGGDIHTIGKNNQTFYNDLFDQLRVNLSDSDFVKQVLDKKTK